MIWEGFEYLHHRTAAEDLITWRCKYQKKYNCHSFLKTKNDIILVGPCRHDSCIQKVVSKKELAKLKKEMKLIGATVHNVLGTTCSNLSNDILEQFPKKSSVKRTLRRAKEGKDLKNTDSLDFVIPDKYHNIVLYDSGPNNVERMIAIGDKEVAKKLNSNLILGDGTFDKSPGIFFQLYSWHSKIGTSYPACIYFLLTNKKSETY